MPLYPAGLCEAVNTALEHLCDVVCPGPHDGIRVAKDVAAAAVLVSAIGAAVLGLATLAPYLAPWLANGPIAPAISPFAEPPATPIPKLPPPEKSASSKPMLF